VIAFCTASIVATLSKNSGASLQHAIFTYGKVREQISRDIGGRPGRHLVLGLYESGHFPGDEIVHNGAEFSSEKILWARSKGSGNDLDLCTAYPDRTFWSVTTDDQNFTLSPLELCK
jgi:hypothetical protein